MVSIVLIIVSHIDNLGWCCWKLIFAKTTTTKTSLQVRSMHETIKIVNRILYENIWVYSFLVRLKLDGFCCRHSECSNRYLKAPFSVKSTEQTQIFMTEIKQNNQFSFCVFSFVSHPKKKSHHKSSVPSYIIIYLSHTLYASACWTQVLHLKYYNYDSSCAFGKCGSWKIYSSCIIFGVENNNPLGIKNTHTKLEKKTQKI